MSIVFGTFAAYGTPLLADEAVEQLILHTASIRHSHGANAKTLLFTDEILTDPRVLPLFDIVRRRSVTRETLLRDRASHYREYLDEHDWLSHICFLDFDILVMHDVHSAFSGEADLYITMRNWSKDMPINGGVIFLEKGKAEACKRFYDDTLFFYDRIKQEHLAWFGDQLALKYALLVDAEHLRVDLIKTRSGALVGVVPRNAYNYTPYDVDTGQAVPQSMQPGEIAFFRERPILHFKGPRKHLMRAIAEAADIAPK